MDLNRIKSVIKTCWLELLFILCGLVLVLSPDTAVALVTKIVAWVLVILGISRVMKNLKDSAVYWGDWVYAAMFFLVGGYLLVNPLSVANMVGRLFGLLLMIRGLQNLKGSVHGSAKVLSLVTLIAGIVLFLLPKTLVNTVLGFAGLVLMVVGAINLADKLRHGNRLEEGDDPNIIDAAQ